MGLLDIFRNKPKNKQPEFTDTSKRDYDVEYGLTNDGKLQVDYYDRHADFSKFYNVTRVIVNEKPLNIEGHEVYNCIVSWYGDSDCQIVDERTGKFESPRASEYRGVLAQIDLNLLQNDPEYCSAVMKNLLDKKRVERYLETGLEENPEIPCGKYVGGIFKTDQGYKKIFSRLIGYASHTSPLMINRRRKNREIIEDKKRKDIENKKAQIKKLQSEIDDISK